MAPRMETAMMPQSPGKQPNKKAHSSFKDKTIVETKTNDSSVIENKPENVGCCGKLLACLGL